MDMDTQFNSEYRIQPEERVSSYSVTGSRNGTERSERQLEIVATEYGSCSYHDAAIADAREAQSHRFP